MGRVLVALVVLNVPAGMVAGPSGSMGASLGVKLVVYVNRTDGTVERYVKEGDLILLNFARTLVMMFSGMKDPDDENIVTAVAGKTYRNVRLGYGGYGCSGAIRLGNSSITSPSLSDYTLGNEVVKFCIQDADITVNGSDMIVDVFGFYTFDAAYNITEVGLSYYMADVSDPAVALNDEFNILVFHDVLPTPIQVNAGDGITVHYYIYLDNP